MGSWLVEWTLADEPPVPPGAISVVTAVRWGHIVPQRTAPPPFAGSLARRASL